MIYPTKPLYDADEKRLTDKARKALIRVFKVAYLVYQKLSSFQICDRDNDGYLNDTELNEFQKLCFGIPLTSTAIEDVKRAVADGCPDGVVDEALALPGKPHAFVNNLLYSYRIPLFALIVHRKRTPRDDVGRSPEIRLRSQSQTRRRIHFPYNTCIPSV